MTVVVVGSLHASPGATTVALALAGCLENGVVVEADPDGGVLAVRFGLPREPGVLTLAADREALAQGELIGHAQEVAGGVRALVGPESGERARWLWASAGAHLLAGLQRHPGVVVVDGGRLSSASPLAPLLGETDLTLIVARPRADELAVVAAWLRGRDGRGRADLVLIGDRPYSARQVSAELGCGVAGVVADDARGVSPLWDGGSRARLARSAFARSVTSLGEAVGGRLAHELPETAESPQAAAP